MPKKCYVCGADATSKEHVPPKCFFPEDSTYRQQLITVPSCTKHNADTSADDEYVRNVISMCIGNNAVGFNQFKDKTVESFTDSIGLLKRTVGNSQRVLTSEGLTRAFEIDRNRFDRVMKKVGYGLFSNEFGVPWNRGLIVATRNIRTQNMSEDDFGPLIEWAEENCPPLPEQGRNPKVFQYTLVGSKEDRENTSFRISFYENFVVWIFELKGSRSYRM